MALDIGGTLRSGYDRLLTPVGLQLVALAFVVQLVANVVNDTTTARLAEEGSAFSVEPGPLVVDLPPGVLGVLSLLSIVGSLVVTLVALRTFAADATVSIPAEAYGEDLLWPAAHLLAGTVVLFVTVAIGLVLLIVPGLFLLVSLILFQVYVAVEDEGFLDAMSDSWALARGNRVDLFLVGVGVFLVAVAVGVLFGVLGVALAPASPYLEGIAATVGGSVVSTYVLATVVAAYDRLTEGAAGEEPSSDPEIDTDWHR